MTKKLRTAVIGVGNMGQHHARIYSEIATLISVADVNSILAKKIATKYKTNCYNNYEDMIIKEKIDALSIVVSTPLHNKIALCCLQNHIPILIEKPIADTVISAEEIINTANKYRTYCMVGHIERFNPAVIKLKQLITSNTFGNIISLLAIRVGINPPRQQGSDVALDLAIHDIDIFNYLLNSLPLKNTIVRTKIKKGNIADSASLLIQYPQTAALIQTNWITPIKMRKLYITGSTAFAELDYISQKLTLHKKQRHKKNDNSFLDILSLSQSSIKEIYISKKEPLKQELLYFLNNYKKKNVDEITLSSLSALKAISYGH